jgi:hypothetical protein
MKTILIVSLWLALLLFGDHASAQRLVWTYSPPQLSTPATSVRISEGYGVDAIGNAAVVTTYYNSGLVGSRFTWLSNRGVVRITEEFPEIPIIFRVAPSTVTILLSGRLRKYTLVRGHVSTTDFDIPAGSELIFSAVPQNDANGFFLATGQNTASPRLSRYAK